MKRAKGETIHLVAVSGDARLTLGRATTSGQVLPSAGLAESVFVNSDSG